MAVEIVTKSDLEQFRNELFQDLKSFIKNPIQKKWLKSYEVKKLLGISQGTLQNLRVNGMLQCSKIGAIYFYDYDDIIKLIEENKSKPLPKLFKK